MARPDEEKSPPTVPIAGPLPAPLVVPPPDQPAPAQVTVTAPPEAQVVVPAAAPQPVAVPPEPFMQPRAQQPVEVQVGLPVGTPLTPELTGQRPVPLLTPAPEEPSLAQPQPRVERLTPPPGVVERPAQPPQVVTVQAPSVDLQPLYDEIASLRAQVSQASNAWRQSPEYRALIDEADRSALDAVRAQTTAADALRSANVANALARQARRLIEASAANPNLVAIPPSQADLAEAVAAGTSDIRATIANIREQLANVSRPVTVPTVTGAPSVDIGGAVAEYVAMNPASTRPTDKQVSDALAALLPAHPELRGPQGLPGKDGRDGANGADGKTPTEDDIRRVVAAFFAGLADFLQDPRGYIWSTIISGFPTRVSQIIGALLGVPA